MKIAILTHFNSFQAGYALAVGWLERARLLEFYGQDFDFLVNETCPDGLYPNQRNCLDRIESDSPFEDRVEFFTRNYKEVLEEYDIILTADVIYQTGGNFLAQNQAMRNANDHFKEIGKSKFWLHWVHSGWTEPLNAPYPESLRHTMMDDSFLVYMNKAEVPGLAQMYNTSLENVRCVYNPKDYRSFHEFHPMAWDVTQCLDIPNKDVVQIFPHCSTRMDAKGIKEVAQTHAALKRAGKTVALVFANSNARSVQFELDMKRKWLELIGLIENEDYIFTSTLTEKMEPLPRKAVADLFRCSNLFVFGSWREVCPNVLLEAKISDNLLVVSDGLPCAKEFAGEDAIYFHGTSKIPGKADGSNDMRHQRMTAAQWDKLAQKIIKRLPSRKHLWDYSFTRIWETQFKPLLDEAEERLA